ncbi:MAG: signal peptidase I [Hespellia sp.]|nr:signal peptidase I [Hespellia sp.]
MKNEHTTTILEEVKSWVKLLVISVVIAVFINHCIIVNATIPSGSMENTLQPGDRVLASRFSYAASKPQRGDIVIFKYPVDDALGKGTLYIKRIIGLPGETVEIKNAKIYINHSSQPLDEPYLKEEWKIENDGYTFQVPEGSYFMMGDNRNSSLDSRYWAEQAVLAGIAANSEDAQQYSFVPEGKILGEAGLKYWPINEAAVLK